LHNLPHDPGRVFQLVPDVQALIVGFFNASDGYFRYHHNPPPRPPVQSDGLIAVVCESRTVKIVAVVDEVWASRAEN
jgi:hypothetical protein